MGENYDYQTPSQAELMQWANDYGLNHPVVADPGFNITAQYLWAASDFSGSFFLPNMQLLSPGMVVAYSNTWLYEGQVVNYLP